MDTVDGKVWFAFLGAAAAWSVQLIVGYALVSHGCYPSSDPLMLGAYGWRYGAGIVTLVTLFIAILSLSLAWRLVTSTPDRPVGFETGLALADAGGVVRYLSFAGVIIGIVFTAMIVFNGLAIILEPTCRFA
jgi:hypothetical protein